MRKAWKHLLVLVPAALIATGCAGNVGSVGAGPPLDMSVRQITPEQVNPTLAQAENDLRERRLDTALGNFQSVLRVQPDNPRAHTGVAESYIAMGNGDLALKAYADWPGQTAEQPQALQGRGIAHLLTGNEAAAQPLLTKAVEADPSLWRAWNALGLTNDRKRNWTQADICYQRAAKANPGAAEVLNNRGYSLMQRGEHAASVSLFRQALQIDPTLEAARNNLTLATALQGRYEGALTAIPSEAMPVALNNVGYAALLRGDYPTAETYLTRAVQTSPRHFERANENLRWLTYLRGSGTENARAPSKAAKAASPVQLAPSP
jgi:Flp pilus assembly protein TadD